MTADQIVTLLLAVAGIVVAILKARGQARAAALLEIAIRGVERGSKVGGTLAIKHAVAELAEINGLAEPMRREVARITGDSETGRGDGALR